MKRRIAVIILLLAVALLVANHFHNRSLRGKWGYIDRDGQMVIKPQYINAYSFNEGLAAVYGIDDSPRGPDESFFCASHIDKRGKAIIRQGWPLPSVEWSSDGSKQNKDITQTHVVDQTLHTPCSEGLIAVNIKGQLGYVDKYGRVVIKPNPEWEDAGAFHDGKAWVSLGDRYDGTCRYGYIDITGRYIAKPQFASAEDFSEGLAAVEPGDMKYVTYPSGKTELLRVTSSGKHGFIDRNGKMVIKPEYIRARDFHDGLAAVEMTDGKWGYIDKSGKMVIKPQWDAAGSFFDCLARVRLNGKWGMIDKSGKYIIIPRYSNMGDYSEGLIAVELNKKGGYIDRSGRIIIKPQFDMVDGFEEGRALVCVGKRYGFIDKTGRIVIKPRYSWAYDFSEGLAAVEF